MQEELACLIALAVSQLEEFGLSESTIKAYQRAFSYIVSVYEGRNLSLYQQDIMEQIISDTELSYKNDELSYTAKRYRIRAVNILDEVHRTGKYEWSRVKEKQDDSLPAYYRDYIDKFLKTLTISHHEVGSFASMLTRFCNFILDHKITDFEQLNQGVVRDFLAYIFPSRPQSMIFAVNTVRRFLEFLQESGLNIEGKIFLVLKNPKKPYKKVRPIISQDNIVKILNGIDRTKSPGKRDFAIILLGVNTGLRSVDIAQLKRTDIHWRELEIHTVQSKTGRIIVLPISEEVRDAIADYILNERPESDSEYVFLTASAPFTPFSSRGQAIRAMFSGRVKDAGIDHKLNDGITFHGLRRTLGTNMLSLGTPITVIAQVFGQNSTESAKSYISTDMFDLKKIALSMASLGGKK